MRLNHLDLHVSDFAETRNFFVTNFGFRHLETKGDDGLAILQDDAGLELVISRPIAKLGGADQAALGVVTYHIGFLLPSRDDVDALYARLVAAGIELSAAPRAMRGGWVFYVTAPGKILVEVSSRT